MRAFVIKKIPIKEHDELIVCYTDEIGKQVFQAKSIMKPTSIQSGHADILNLISFHPVHGKGLPIITSAHCLNAFANIKSSLCSMILGFFVIELFDRTVLEGEHDPKLWHFLMEYLKKLDSLAISKINWQNELANIQKGAIEVLGYSGQESIEFATGHRFKSLQIAESMLK